MYTFTKVTTSEYIFKIITQMRWVTEGKGPHHKHCSCWTAESSDSKSKTHHAAGPGYSHPGGETLQEHPPKCNTDFAMEQRRHLIPLTLDNGSGWALPTGKDTFKKLWFRLPLPSTLGLCWKDWKSLSGAPREDYSNIVACKEQVSWAQLTGFHLAAPVSSLSSTTKYSNFADL